MRPTAQGAAELLPEGYEVRENVHGQVSVRRKRARHFSSLEDRLLHTALKNLRPSGDSSWIRLETLPLSAAAMKYLPHLGRDSFFDLI